MAATAPALPKTFNFRQLEELWVTAGGSRAEATTAAAIALAESGGNPNAENHNSNASIDRGLWQINSVHGALSTTGVLANAKAAVRIRNEAKGWSPWVTFKTGAYQQFLTPANFKSGIDLEPGAEPQAGLFGITEGKAPGFSHEGGTEHAITSNAEEAKEKIEWLFSGKNWGEIAIGIVLLLAGAVLMVYGIMVAVRPRESALSLPSVPLAV